MGTYEEDLKDWEEKLRMGVFGPPPQPEDYLPVPAASRKAVLTPPRLEAGDPNWWRNKRHLNLRDAADSVGIGDRQRRALVQAGVLIKVGGHFITTASLRAYWFGKHPKKKRQ